MAEVISALPDENMGGHMPADELLDSQRREVYKTVGEQLMWCYEFDGEVPSHGSFLVELADGRRVAYSYGGCMSLDAVSWRTDSSS